ncbi:DUF4170 domain-containing protein [Sneathiella sp. CAU 1612]|jgi:hypothetical protein|uniref:DUF4170 domain-containing protein n=1 Tax=Sneathiella sedimenti TaxID=2816034 RepID=A0ABS3F365_9PROT|nr:DUF4170 domain-containing protein [Sneathiella sedimenti]MBO0332961.1 DUF4170 domain-containing protein [Sneathiella sedimenti]
MPEAKSKLTKDLFVVFGGKVTDTRGKDFVDPEAMDVRGFYSNYDDALAAWRAASQMKVDDAFTKYVIVRLW